MWDCKARGVPNTSELSSWGGEAFVQKFTTYMPEKVHLRSIDEQKVT